MWWNEKGVSTSWLATIFSQGQFGQSDGSESSEGVGVEQQEGIGCDSEELKIFFRVQQHPGLAIRMAKRIEVNC